MPCDAKMGMRKPQFRRGDLVKVIHGFDHESRPSADADALLGGDLFAYVYECVAGDGGCDPAYALEWHGDGQTARCLPDLEGSGWSVCSPDRHHAGTTSAWWSERCLALVTGRPNP